MLFEGSASLPSHAWVNTYSGTDFKTRSGFWPALVVVEDGFSGTCFSKRRFKCLFLAEPDSFEKISAYPHTSACGFLQCGTHPC